MAGGSNRVPRAAYLKTIYAMLLHGNVLVFYGCVEQPIIFSISNFDEGTNVQILGAGSATSTAECRMGCRLYLVRVLVTTADWRACPLTERSVSIRVLYLQRV